MQQEKSQDIAHDAPQSAEQDTAPGAPQSAEQGTPAPQTPAPKARGVVLMLVLALALGAVAAAVVWIFIFAMGLSYEYLWHELPALLALPFLPVIICGIGGLIIGLWEKYVWEPPMLLEESLEIISKEKRFPYKGLPKTVVSSFLPLAFGGAIGPEAGLVNIIAGLCTWIGDKLKRAGVASAELAEAGMAATLTALFGTPVAGIVAPLEGRFEAGKEEVTAKEVTAKEAAAKEAAAKEAAATEGAATEAKASQPEAAASQPEASQTDAGCLAKTSSNPATSQDPHFSKQHKMLVYLAAIVGGLAVMMLLNNLFGGGLGLPRFERTSWQAGELLWAIPLSLVGVALGYLFHAANSATGALAKKLNKYTLVRTIGCGLLLGLAGSFLPLTMFSGEEQMAELIQGFSSMTALVLILTAVVKVIVCPLCVNMGWRGGNIFPVIFAGVSIGYGVALLTGLDPTFCVTVLATSVTVAVMRKPVLSVAVLLLCFPVADLVFMAVAALVAGIIPLPKILQAKSKEEPAA